MNLDELHRLIDEWAAKQTGNEVIGGPVEEEPKRVLPEGKRVVRTKSSGDKVFYLDDVAKTKAWVTSPEVLQQLGFELNDVVELPDNELIGYQLKPSIYKVDNATPPTA